ncbi:uracil-DNA glycosylase family protein [Marinilongibacter aquaticus]|uniref:uracil-DNA glycosylase family protein n=1 Tax=Marinilongibacter aquaticus TaxID=2975157 RepID=UPI0021BDE1C7|nr:uracil-DNA glycosylase family protein [Marinilongibacter aquaticus]UBM60370.1 uracil-DNA glycosylase family protein [Marinilongibacter aquaticus]
MQELLQDIQACRICQSHLPLGPRPVLQVSKKSRIVIIGQAPGLKVHQTGIPWDDKSGDRLREWLGVSKKEFYNPEIFALIPMGFCYPGRGKSGDLPPRPECQAAWHDKIWQWMEGVRLTVLVGQYAQKAYLHESKSTLTETVKSAHEYLPRYFPLPHPSPRNNIWQAKNPWFTDEILPLFLQGVANLL